MKIAAAQLDCSVGEIETNLKEHCRLIGIAAANGAQLIAFPEMSITGYCRQEAQALAFVVHDKRISILQEQSTKGNIIIVAGAPICVKDKLHIGSFIIYPNEVVEIYTKQYLHKGEEQYFFPSFDYNTPIHFESENIALAICADIGHCAHPADAKASGASIYLASIFYGQEGISKGKMQLSSYAKKHRLAVLMSNYCGAHWNMQAGGASCFINAEGEELAALGTNKCGLLLAKLNNGHWQARAVVC